MSIYKPYLMRIAQATDEAPGVKTFRLEFVNPKEGEAFSFKAGQFGEYSAFGYGESTFCIASPHTRKGYIECTFRQAGRVTTALNNMTVGDIVGFRGPYGNTFPIEQWQGKNIIFATGGIALPPIRCVIWTCLDERQKYRDVTIIYGAKTVADLVYKHEIKEWEARSDVTMLKTVDPGGQTKDWDGRVDFFPTTLKEYLSRNPKQIERAFGKKDPDAVYELSEKIDVRNTVVAVCGPPFVIKMCLDILSRFGFTTDQVWTTLENRMKCGIGKCGRCNVGGVYVCKEGPVFTATQLKNLPNDS